MTHEVFPRPAYRNGVTLPIDLLSLRNATLVERFWKYTRASDVPGECWMWNGTRSDDGYGVTWGRSAQGTRRNFRVHRVSWVIHFGDIPDGLFVCHHCDVPLCVNPRHLFLGTATDNNRDRANKHGATRPPESYARKPPNFWQAIHPEHILRGSTHPQAKLSEQQVLDIRRRFALGGVSKVSLARDFGVTDGLIRYIVSGRGWTHVQVHP